MELNQQVNVLVIGDIALDSYWECDTNRISPEAPVPVSKVKKQYTRAGCAANVALNITALGAHATLIGYVGKDKYADELKNILTHGQVDCAFLTSQQPTINKLRLLSQNQQLIRADFEESFADEDINQLLAHIEQHLAQASAVILSDYGKGTLANPQPIIQLIKSKGLPILVDPKGSSFAPYAGSTIITPNLKEFTAVVGDITSEDSLITKARAELSAHDLTALLITRSADGMTLVEENGAVTYVSTQAKEVFDVTGAGDTVIATLSLAIASGHDLPHAMKIANAAGGVVVGKAGTATMSMTELDQEFNAIPKGAFLNKDEAKKAIELAQALGQKIVMTNGCFDIIHAGHVSYLAAAKKLGDKLIIAVNTDHSVTRLKGPTRPINSLENRMTVLQALESVDWVISFDEDTPQGLIEHLLPDVLVKGADYQISEIAGAKVILANGGEVKTIELVPGCSTTHIVNKIQGD